MISGTGFRAWPLACALAWLAAAFGVTTLQAAEAGSEVVVVFNKNLAESQRLAEYYSRLRQVPSNQMFGFDLPTTEEMSRREFHSKLAKSLLEKLEKNKLFVYGQKPSGQSGSDRPWLPIRSKIRYLALCYGVPLRVAHDPNFEERNSDQLRPELRRDEAAVESELALLPQKEPACRVFGSVNNRFYGATKASSLCPTNGLLLVTRLDGPSFEIARGEIDKALEAEANGLWGRAYFDARGLTNTPYQLGDQFILRAADFARRLGFETVVDDHPATFPPSFPMSHIAFYAGWYDGQLSGPFTQPQVEFVPGAFAYHLHSFSAVSIRTTQQGWVGPLLDKGATITMGSVAEPYLEGTPDIAIFFSRLVYFGFSFGEAAYASQLALSWQTTVVGDPLYRPFAKSPLAWHEQLSREHKPQVVWSHLRAVNLNLARGLPIPKAIAYLESVPETKSSAVLEEKIGDLRAEQSDNANAIIAYKKALELDPSPQQRIRLWLNTGRLLEMTGQNARALELYDHFRRQFSSYSDMASIYKEMLGLAELLGKKDEAEEWQRALANLNQGK